MPILITGSNGLLGSHLVEILCAQGLSVIGIDNYCGSYLSSVIKHPNFTFHQGDCADLVFMKSVCEGQGIEAIFHTACLAHEGWSVLSPVQISSSVFNLTTVVSTVAAQYNIKKIYNFSSMARYGEGSDRPFVETDPVAPIDPYGVAKVAAEQMLNVMSDLYGLQVVHLVPHNVFGNRGKWNDPNRGVLYIMINRALRGEPLLVHGDGEQKRSFSFADDVLSFVPLMIDLNLPNKEVINIGPDSQESYMSINKLASMVSVEMERQLGIVVAVEHGPARPREAKQAWCSSNKVRSLFGWENKKKIGDGIGQVVKYVVEHGARDWDEEMVPEIDLSAI